MTMNCNTLSRAILTPELDRYLSVNIMSMASKSGDNFSAFDLIDDHLKITVFEEFCEDVIFLIIRMMKSFPLFFVLKNNPFLQKSVFFYKVEKFRLKPKDILNSFTPE